MLRSRTNTLLSVRRVTERNAGRTTAGVDGEVALTSRAKTMLVDEVHRDRTDWRARPVKRPDEGSRQGPLPLLERLMARDETGDPSFSPPRPVGPGATGQPGQTRPAAWTRNPQQRRPGYDYSGPTG